MSRRRHTKQPISATPALPAETRADAAEASLLIVHPCRSSSQRLASDLRAWPIGCVHATSLSAAGEALADRDFDLVLVSLDLPDGSGLDLTREYAAAGGIVLLMADNPSLDIAVSAMRAGAIDLLCPTAAPTELMDRIVAALRRARVGRRQQERIARLRRVCRQLNTARQEVSRQVGSLCNDLVSAYNELSDQLGRVSIASEFGSLVRQELDIEDLLRTGLEYLLAKGGPTNAAVFLPDSAGEYTLGAYVNYDCPKEGAEAMFDHLANIIAPRFENARGLVVMEDEAELMDRFGDDARWLDGNACLVFTCRHDDECLAVVTLFRSPRQPFSSDFLSILPIVAETFARQLGRVIHVHHRHLPKDQWGTFGSDDSDYGLAA